MDIVEQLKGSLSAGYSELRASAADEIERLRSENEALRKDAERYRQVVAMVKHGAMHHGSVVNDKLLTGHRDKNRMLVSILFSGDAASALGCVGFTSAIDAAIKGE